MNNFQVKVIANSITEQGKPIVTFQLRYPRYIHAELMTHRVFSRNAGSSRAIPVAKLAERALAEMVEPIKWLKNQPGMQASEEELDGKQLRQAKLVWKRMAEFCAQGAEELAKLGLHKQWANRPLEWFSTISVVVTSTEWDNWYELRNHPDAQPEIRNLAAMMFEAQENSVPVQLKPGQWHLPYVSIYYKGDMNVVVVDGKERWVQTEGTYQIYNIISGEGVVEVSLEDALKSSAAYCARVSYEKHDGTAATVAENIQLHDRLVGSAPIHASPIEHQASPDLVTTKWHKFKAWITGSTVGSYANSGLHGNFKGWVQHRKFVEVGKKASSFNQ
jgi:thymidylate synthase ThyX